MSTCNNLSLADDKEVLEAYDLVTKEKLNEQ